MSRFQTLLSIQPKLSSFSQSSAADISGRGRAFRYHEPCVLYQLPSSFKLGEKQPLLGFVRKGHVLGAGDLTHGMAPSAGYTCRNATIGVKDKSVLRIPHRDSGVRME